MWGGTAIGQGGVVERVARYALRTGRLAPHVGLQVGAGALAILLATMIGAGLPTATGLWRAVPVAVAVLTFALFGVDAAAVASTAVLGYLLVIGFLVNRFGELSWHGAPDVGRIALIGGAAAAGFAVGIMRRRHRRCTERAVAVYARSAVPRQKSQDSYIGEGIRNG
jgi:hypothetical protein